MTQDITSSEPTHVAFDGHVRIARGTLAQAALAVKHAAEVDAAGPLLVFEAASGRVIDLDLRGSDAEALARLPGSEAVAPRGPGRPKLGVAAREVTLLPRHWEWLATQPGGASAALRKLVEAARRETGSADARRAARDGAYRFMSSIGGDLPDFEEASRALFAGDLPKLRSRIAAWPADVQTQLFEMLAGAFD